MEFTLLPLKSLLLGVVASPSEYTSFASVIVEDIWFVSLCHGFGTGFSFEMGGDIVGSGGLSLMSSRMPGGVSPFSSISNTSIYDTGDLFDSISSICIEVMH